MKTIGQSAGKGSILKLELSIQCIGKSSPIPLLWAISRPMKWEFEAIRTGFGISQE